MHPEVIVFLKQSVLILFFALFIGICVYAARMPKSEVEALSELPLASDEYPLETGGAPRG